MKVMKSVLGLVLLAALLLVGCSSDSDDGLSAAEVEGIVESAIAGIPAPEMEPGLSAAEVEGIVESAIAGIPAPEMEPGLSAAEVEGIVESAIAGIPDSGLSAAEVEGIVESAIAGIPDSGLSAADVEDIARGIVARIPSRSGLSAADVEDIARGIVARIPSRDAEADYTKFVVANAISRYESDGLEATLAYYNSLDSLDGQWYVFIVGEDDTVIGHYESSRRGLDLNGWVGTDANGYVFGAEMLSADENGRWVSYVYRNPTSGDINLGQPGDLELKNAWVVRHDGLLFGSGWYIQAEEWLQDLVVAVADQLSLTGLEATISRFTQPSGFAGGLASTLSYYENAESADGKWIGFIADQNGILASAFNNPQLEGTNIAHLLGTSVLNAPESGIWATEVTADPATDPVADSIRIWVVSRGDYLVGGGWYSPPAG